MLKLIQKKALKTLFFLESSQTILGSTKIYPLASDPALRVGKVVRFLLWLDESK